MASSMAYFAERILIGDINALNDFLKHHDPLTPIYKHGRTILHTNTCLEIIKGVIKYLKINEPEKVFFAVNSRDDKGRTPINLWAKKFCIHEKDAEKIVQYLLDHGANPNIAENKFGMTTLHWIATTDYDTECLKLFIKNNPNPYICCNSGHTPETLASACNNASTKIFLKEYSQEYNHINIRSTIKAIRKKRLQ